MHAEAQRRLGHALQAIRSIQTYTAHAPLPECLTDELTRSAVQRQLGIVQEALRVALPEEPSLRQTWPEVDSLLEGVTRPILRTPKQGKLASLMPKHSKPAKV